MIPELTKLFKTKSIRGSEGLLRDLVKDISRLPLSCPGA